jgi:predicted dienelactone hydrolase
VVSAVTALKRLLALVVLGALAHSASATTGVTVLPARADTGPITVFYPTAAAPARFVRGTYSFQLAADAAPQPGNGRLVVMSHGSGGAPWPQVDLAIALTDVGFTVAMPEHKGDNWHDMRDVGPATWRQRPREVSKAIDAMAADPRFAKALEFQRVGVYGMSAGGLTALTLAGAQWSPALLAKHCDAHLTEDLPACVGLATSLTGSVLDTVRLGVARWVIDWTLANQTTLEGWTDPRIKAAVSAVPMAAVIDLPSIATPRIPLGLVRAAKDDWLAPRWHIDAVREACKSCVLVADMSTAGHGSILSPQPTGLEPRAARLLNDPPGFDRAILPGAYSAITRFFVQNLVP